MNILELEQPDCEIPANTFILAKNWDRLGGRVHAILNGYLISKILDLEFRFIWPYEERCPEVFDQIKIFSTKFVQEHRVYENQLQDWEQEFLPIACKQSSQEYRVLVSNSVNRHYLRYSDFFKVPQFSDIDTYALFMQCSSEIFSKEFLEIDRQVCNSLQELDIQTVFHLRYGDILNGSFRHYPDPSKYLPYCVVFKMLSQMESNKKVVLISDTSEISRCLSNLDNRYYTSDEIGIPKDSDEFQSTIRDLLIMKHCQSIFAVSLSAFSQLGTHLGGQEVKTISIAKEIQNINEFLGWMESKNFYENIPTDLVGNLFARDITQLMNTHSKFLSLNKWFKIASKSVLADPEYVIGAAQLALVYSFKGQFSIAISKLTQVKKYAEEARRTHEDPLVYLGVIEFFCLYMEIIKGIKKGNPSSSRLLFTKCVSLIASLKKLDPFQIQLSDLIVPLEESLVVLDSELAFLESKTNFELRVFSLKHNQIIRTIFQKKIKYLSADKVFSLYYSKSRKEDLLSILTDTLTRLSKSF